MPYLKLGKKKYDVPVSGTFQKNRGSDKRRQA